MKQTTRIYNKWQGYTLADCDCKYCVYYGGKRKGKITCLADQCVCADEIRRAKKRRNSQKEEKMLDILCENKYNAMI